MLSIFSLAILNIANYTSGLQALSSEADITYSVYIKILYFFRYAIESSPTKSSLMEQIFFTCAAYRDLCL